MIITCPECATRYDLEDERFLPHGRSVRCTACGESWFVPAPEPIEALSRRDVAPRSAPDRGHRREAADFDGRDHDRASGHDRFENPVETRERARFTDDQKKYEMRPPQRDEDASDFADDSDGYDKDGHPVEAEVSIVQEEKDLLPPRDEKGRFMPRSVMDDDEDDALFDSPAGSHSRDDNEKVFDNIARKENAEEPPKGWRRGKQFYVEDKDAEPEEDPRPFFAKHFSKGKRDDEAPIAIRRDRETEEDRDKDKSRFNNHAQTHRETPLHASREGAPRRREPDFKDERAHFASDTHRRDDRGDADRETSRDHYRDHDHAHDHAHDHERSRHASRAHEARQYEHNYDDDEDDILPGEATILDADWEDVDNGTGPRFGRRIREERRRATALARLEDVRRFEPEALDEEFFRSLRVTPYELEKAVRKARRRAEARDKNRMTPWRAFGWSAWVAAVAGAAYAVVAYRDEIVKVAPTTAEAYAVVGIETDPFGLKIENVRHRLAMSTGGPMIEISGSLRNRGADALDAPLLQAEALGPRGELLARWTFRPDEPTVGGDGVVAFTTRNAAPDGVTEVALTFAPAQSSIAPQ